MHRKLVQITGIVWTLVFASLIVWLYATEPRSLKDVGANTQVAVGTYQVNQEQFNNGLTFFRRDQFRAARDQWALADPLKKDARTQFLVAYAFYREGWGRLYNDKDLFKQGLDAAKRAISLAPNGSITIDDPDLQMHTPAELKAELEQGVEGSWSDINPLKVFRTRK